MANKGQFTIGPKGVAIRGDSSNNSFVGSPKAQWIEGGAGNDVIGTALNLNAPGYTAYQSAIATGVGSNVSITFQFQPNQAREFWVDSMGSNVEGRYELRVYDSSDRLLVSYAGMLSPSDPMNLAGKPLDRWSFESILAAGQNYRIEVSGTYLDPNTGKRRSTVFVPRLQWVDAIEGDSFFGEDGDDTLYGSFAADYLSGGNGNDVMFGYHGHDTLLTGEGENWADGGSGHDAIHAGSGKDSLMGGTGNDILKGGKGNDDLKGGSGNDNLYGEDGDDSLEGGTGEDFLIGGLGSDFIYGDGGNDTIFGESGQDTLLGGTGTDSIRGGIGLDYIEGGAGNDKLYGDADRDWIKGDSGDDRIEGGSADDTLIGDQGNDTLHGDDGNDEILGSDGNDSLKGGAGQDVLRGGAGNDFILGEGGKDSLRGDAGHDTLDGGSSEDTLFGDEGDDSLRGGNSSDFLRGGYGRDSLFGDADHDTLWGDDGEDALFGGSGNDLIYGGSGRDTIQGGKGRDTIDGGSGHDSILGDDDKDEIRGGSGNDWIAGGMGHDVLSGDSGNDTISGGANEDTLYGGGDHDQLHGNSGLDILYGESGNDSLYGGDHQDSLYGQSGNDYLEGGEGHDWLEGGQGKDTLHGGNGNDTLRGSLSFVSKGEIDFLYGGAGNDVFILGTNLGTFYSDGTEAAGKGDYAYLQDFTLGRDRLRLFGSQSDYFSETSSSGSVAGRSLYFDSNRNGKFDANDEMIAFVKGGQGWTSDQILANAQFMGGIMPAVYRPSPPTSSIPLAFRAAIDDGDRWNKTRLTFNFRSYNPENITSETSIFRLSDFVQSIVRDVLASIQTFTNLTFVEVTSGVADLQFIKAKLPAGTAGWAYGPDHNDGSLIVLSNQYNDEDFRTQQKGFSTLLHEIGHALGLEHPHQGSNRLPTSYDTEDFTVMSYNKAALALKTAEYRDQGYSDTFQLFDIAALQAKYGANRTFNADDTTHVIQSSDPVRKTIWDGGGSNDWLVAAGSSYGGASIRLSEGPQSLSIIGLSRVWIAYGSNIEHAQGSELSDSIFGNQLDNHLVGGGGNDYLSGVDSTRSGRWEQDTLTGGTGADRFTLGSSLSRFYDDGKSFSNGIADYALITDFNPNEDALILKGNRSQYHLTSAATFGMVGKALFHDSNLNKLFDERDELIAIVQSKQSLNFGNTIGVASNVQYV